MKALVFHRFGSNDVLALEEVPDPTVRGPRDVLIRVRAAAVNPVDWKLRSGGVTRLFTGSKFPKILGSECSGEVVSIGADVTRFKPGDGVIAFPGFREMGAYAQVLVGKDQGQLKSIRAPRAAWECLLSRSPRFIARKLPAFAAR